jgi:hypothetical protein
MIEVHETKLSALASASWLSRQFCLAQTSDFYNSHDTAHEWQSWRRALREFAPLLFKN